MWAQNLVLQKRQKYVHMHNHKHSFLSVQHKKPPKCAVCRKMTFYTTLSKKAKYRSDDGMKSLSLCTSRLLWYFMTSTVPCRCPLHHNARPLPSPSLLSFSLCLLQLLFWVRESAASSSCISATLAAFASETRKTPTPSPARRGVGLISGVQGDLRCRWKYFFRKPQPG